MSKTSSNIPDVIDTPDGPAVTWYEDGPTARPDDGSDAVEVEDAFREGFFKGAEEAYTWEEPDREAVERAFDRRREAKQRASVRRPEDPPHVWLYRVGHAVEAARLRGFAQALATTADGWDRLNKRGIRHDLIYEELLPYWKSKVEEWVQSDLYPIRTYSPPFIEETALAEVAKPGQTPEDPLSPADMIRAYPPWKTVRQLLWHHTDLRKPAIHGLLREGETMNVIAPSKSNKSWMVSALSICVATGRSWFDRYDTVKGPVLIIGNELHAETEHFRYLLRGRASRCSASPRTTSTATASTATSFGP
ncbi:MAG: AAA family ATPase [Planctomycetota bacterium]